MTSRKTRTHTEDRNIGLCGTRTIMVSKLLSLSELSLLALIVLSLLALIYACLLQYICVLQTSSSGLCTGRGSSPIVTFFPVKTDWDKNSENYSSSSLCRTSFLLLLLLHLRACVSVADVTTSLRPQHGDQPGLWCGQPLTPSLRIIITSTHSCLPYVNVSIFFIIPVLWFTSISIWNWDFSWVKGNHCLRNLITLADKTWHIIIVYKTFLFTQCSGRHDSPTDNTNKYRLSALANTSKQMINVIKKIFRQQITEDLTPVNNNNPG